MHKVCFICKEAKVQIFSLVPQAFQSKTSASFIRFVIPLDEQSLYTVESIVYNVVRRMFLFVIKIDLLEKENFLVENDICQETIKFSHCTSIAFLRKLEFTIRQLVEKGKNIFLEQ
jgi:hypothetical protein